jgi:hypothetical protein
VMRARRLLDEIESPWLKVVIDPANLLNPGDLSRRYPNEHKDTIAVYLPGERFEDRSRLTEVLDEAFDWLGNDIVLAHAKDPAGIEAIGDAELEPLIRLIEQSENPEEDMRRRTSWRGFYRPYVSRLIDAGFQGNLIMHGLDEDEVAPRTLFLREVLASFSRQG